ncbi:MAG: Bax inhibitor-1/YccA family protein [Treponemataceae bacterium]|nr:MAG: Bax inhibitor-1/YccA family protein [Treponemataceae bacterium]
MANDFFAAGNDVSALDSQTRFIQGVYLWMALALAVTAGSSFLTINTGLLYLLIAKTGSIGLYVLMAAELGVVIFFSARIRQMSKSAALTAFFAYAILTGITLSVVFLAYTSESIVFCFVIAAAMFGGMSLYGLVTRSDLTKVGSYLFMALLGVIVASVVNIFLRSGMIRWITSFATVIIFTGLSAYDAQKLTRVHAAGIGSDTRVKQSLMGALELYLDFINIFLALLRIVGRRR